MDEKELAHFKDDILRLLVDKDLGADINWLAAKLKIVGANRDYLKTVLDEIDDWNINVLHVTRNERYYMQPTPLTKKFLAIGGFVNQYESDLEADLQAAAISNQENKIRDLQEENLTLSNQVATMKIKTYWFPIILSSLSAIIAIASLFYPIPDTDLKPELQELKDKVDSLRLDFRKENDDLKERLYEAELLIAVYEGEEAN